MTKLVSLLGRKPEPAIEKPSFAMPPAATLAPANTAPNEAGVDLDNELFFPIAAQLGEENEAVRSLLMDAEHKIGELETIKLSIAKLVDPVCNTLRGYEETKNEKLILQRALKNTRDASSKLRDDLVAAEKKTAAFKAECTRLQDIVGNAKQNIAALQRSKAEQLAELGVQRAHVAELQRLAQQQASDLRLTRDENRRLGDRVATADQRTVQLENQAQTAQQEARQANQERASLQASLEKTLGDLAQTARRLSDADKALATAAARLNAMENNLAEVQTERSRLSAALDEATHEHRDEMNLLSSRFEAMQARLSLTENLLEEARQTLMARADEIRTFERSVVEASTANEVLAEKLSAVEALLAEREMHIKDLEQARAVLTEQAHKLIQALTARESTYEGAQQKIREQSDLAEVLQEELNAARSSNEMQIENFNAQLQREQLERSMTEGALEAARKDIARLQQEISGLRSRSFAESAGETPAAQDALKRAA
jgi:chromosome segregation ATPase